MNQVLYIQFKMCQSSVSVVVVSFNTRDKLRKCLALVEPEHELIVLDNASRDGSVEMVQTEFPTAKLVANTENLGFGAANNLGADMATRPLVLFLNSDAYAEPGAISRLAGVFQDETVVGAGGRLLNMDGSLQESTANRLTLWAVFCEQFYLEKLFPRSRIFSPYWTTRRLIDLPSPQDTEQVMGASLMVRRGLEAFDRNYFMYCEDTDLCSRLRNHGRIVYVKESCFVHELGSSSADNPLKGVANYNLGKETYFHYHHGHLAQGICAGLDWAGALLRALYWNVRTLAGGGDLARQSARGFWLIVRAKLGWR
jgi:N-acetylglucosaminyl-diphospho-decaprenol L-rhamnosyltransferase